MTSVPQNTQTTRSTLKTTSKPRLINFTRDNCLPCEIMSPWVVEIAKMYQGKLEVESPNLDRKAMQPIGRKWRIRTIPTQVYTDATGTEIFRHEGLATKEEMNRIICSKHLVTCP